MPTPITAIAEHLAANKLTQKAFGEALSTDTRKVGQGLVWQWINGDTAITPQMAVAIWRRFGIPRQRLRPDDWREIWPELTDLDEVPTRAAA